ncbi:hypothetical protein [Nonomuraea sp. NPDC049158]|uniref:hypothetical protein n=1 Tax=Nonomuraea sp. NPDC049158 TaxID=3155649 RepID=UPI0033D66BA1
MPEHRDRANLRATRQGCHLHYGKDHPAQTRARTRAAKFAAAGQDPLFGFEEV